MSYYEIYLIPKITLKVCHNCFQIGHVFNDFPLLVGSTRFVVAPPKSKISSPVIGCGRNFLTGNQNGRNPCPAAELDVSRTDNPCVCVAYEIKLRMSTHGQNRERTKRTP